MDTCQISKISFVVLFSFRMDTCQISKMSVVVLVILYMGKLFKVFKRAQKLYFQHYLFLSQSFLLIRMEAKEEVAVFAE